jgi:hypothetical protein
MNNFARVSLVSRFFPNGLGKELKVGTVSFPFSPFPPALVAGRKGNESRPAWNLSFPPSFPNASE